MKVMIDGFVNFPRNPLHLLLRTNLQNKLAIPVKTGAVFTPSPSTVTNADPMSASDDDKVVKGDAEELAESNAWRNAATALDCGSTDSNVATNWFCGEPYSGKNHAYWSAALVTSI